RAARPCPLPCLFRYMYFWSLLALYSVLFHHTPTTGIYTLSLHDALPIWEMSGHPVQPDRQSLAVAGVHQGTEILRAAEAAGRGRSEEHTSELQSRFDLVCRLLLEKKKGHKNSQRADGTANTHRILTKPW